MILSSWSVSNNRLSWVSTTQRSRLTHPPTTIFPVACPLKAHGRAILYKTVLITHKTQLAWLDRTLRGALVRQSAPLAELTTTLILALPAYQTDDESIHVLALLLEKLVNLRSVVCTGRGHSGPTDILLRLSVSVTLPRSLVSVTFLPLSMFTRRELCRFLEQVASQLEELSVVTFSRTMEWDKTRVHSSEGLGGEIEIVEGWLRERAEIALLRLRSLKVAAVPGISPPGDEYAEAFLRYLLKTPSNLDSLERLHLPTNSILTVAAASSTTSSTRAPIPLLDPLLLWSASSLREIWLSGPPPSDETIGALTAVDTLTVPYVGFEAYLPIWSGIKDLGLVDTEAPLSLDDSTPKQLDLSLRRLRRFIQKRDKEDGLKGVERLDWMAQLDWRRAT